MAGKMAGQKRYMGKLTLARGKLYRFELPISKTIYLIRDGKRLVNGRTPALAFSIKEDMIYDGDVSNLKLYETFQDYPPEIVDSEPELAKFMLLILTLPKSERILQRIE
jgi:hypothetical protein